MVIFVDVFHVFVDLLRFLFDYYLYDDLMSVVINWVYFYLLFILYMHVAACVELQYRHACINKVMHVKFIINVGVLELDSF